MYAQAGRYGRQPIDLLMAMPFSMLKRYMTALGDVLKTENRKGSAEGTFED
jgi:hypothetical protein